ncbi:MAG: flavodoxin family protein [Synergistaceae bacterium]|jgi:multimeric flavodoxin WrbA|nr:flavodoxin family protein [Synergistaceae bacterium]
MKKVIAVNGSPRKTWNTATLLRYAMDGAASKGAETKLVHLYDISFKGCVSCFACKRKEDKSRGCALNDGLKPLLDEIAEAEGLILGSPIYLWSLTGEMRSFLERLAFPYIEYNPEHSSLYRGNIRTGWITTMNVPEKALAELGCDKTLEALTGLMKRIFGHCESLVSTDTLQFEDYSKYDATAFDADAKKRRREEVFPKDCEKAFGMGARFAE